MGLFKGGKKWGLLLLDVALYGWRLVAIEGFICTWGSPIPAHQGTPPPETATSPVLVILKRLHLKQIKGVLQKSVK
jgi:hypothetical protein